MPALYPLQRMLPVRSVSGYVAIPRLAEWKKFSGFDRSSWIA